MCPWRIHLVDRLFFSPNHHIVGAFWELRCIFMIIPPFFLTHSAPKWWCQSGRELNWMRLYTIYFMIISQFFFLHNNNKKSLLKTSSSDCVSADTYGFFFSFTLMSLLNAGIIHHPTLHSRSLFFSTIFIIVLIIQFEWQKSFSFPFFTFKHPQCGIFDLDLPPLPSNGAKL